MSRELAEQTHDIREEITGAIVAEDRNGLLPLLRDLRELLTGRGTSEEEEEILEDEVDKFLQDKLRISMCVPLGKKGGPPCLTIFREKGVITFHLDDEGDKHLREKWGELQKAA